MKKTTAQQERQTFKLGKDSYYGNKAEAEMDYDNRDEFYRKYSFKDWCEEMVQKVRTPAQPAAPSNKEVFRKGQQVYLKSDTNVGQVVDDPAKDWSLWQANKEVLNITGEMVEDGFAQPMSFEIAKAYNETYGKGYNPAAMDEVVEALKRSLDWFYAHAKGKKIYANGVTPSCIPYIETALNNAKLQKP